MAQFDRRKEQRYIVDNVYLQSGDYQVPIVDLSATAARVSCNVGELQTTGEPCHLVFEDENGIERIPVNPEITRSTDYYVVVSYEPPRDNWELFIEKFDSFHVDEDEDENPAELETSAPLPSTD